MRFKEFLLEYLTDEQRKKYAKVKMSANARKATDHFFGKDIDGVKEDLKNYDHDKSEIHHAVERHLGTNISHEEYRKGMIKDNYGRDAKIGRQIKDKHLLNAYTNDAVRAGAKKGQQHYVSIVRGTEVAGQTNSAKNKEHPKGHSWGEESCKNVDTGMNNHYLKPEIKHGTVVMRVHDHNNQEIYRATLQPHLKDTERGQDDKDRVYALDSEYGVKHPTFTAHAHDVAKRLSGPYRPGVFNKHTDVYDNSGMTTTFHPATDLAKLDDMSKDGDYSDALLNSNLKDKLKPKHLENIWNARKNGSIPIELFRHKDLPKSVAYEMADHENKNVRSNLARTTKHKDVLSKLAKDEDDWVRDLVPYNHNTSDDDLLNYLKSDAPYSRRRDVVDYSGNIKERHIDHLLKTLDKKDRLYQYLDMIKKESTHERK